MVMRILVVPSNREECLKAFLAAWDKLRDWDRIIVVEDGPERTFDLEVDGHYSWAEIDETLGPDAWIVSRRDSAVRCFGLLMAYRMGATHILTLDDDCYPHDRSPIFAGHVDRMEGVPRWIPSVPGMMTRGLPYRNLGTASNVVASMGLWSGIPDLDAIQSLNDLDFATDGRFAPPAGSRIMPAGQYFPLCGMNFCIRADVTPLAYFPLMGDGSPYRRFDDIWMGIIFKRIADHLGLAISVGEPFVRHQRASDVMVNLVKEAPGIAANETFWEAIDAVPLSGRSAVACMAEMGASLETDADPYIAGLGRKMKIWAGLF
jgi:reversibly glycosylated polypeptide/UDP-arabinopyranose mutase